MFGDIACSRGATAGEREREREGVSEFAGRPVSPAQLVSHLRHAALAFIESGIDYVGTDVHEIARWDLNIQLESDIHS